MKTIIRFGTAIIFVLILFKFAISASAGINQWTTNGPYGGNITTLAVSPNYPIDKTLFTSAYCVGLFKSTDGGVSWAAINNGIMPDQYNDINIVALAVSPNYANDQTIFAGTGYVLYKSTDGGISWTTVKDATSGIQINAIAISPNFSSDQTVFAGTDNGLFQSTDGGASWKEVDSGITPNSNSYVAITAIALSPNYISDHTIFVGTADDGVFKSVDGGASWTEINNGIGFVLGGDYISDIAVSPNYSMDKAVFAVEFQNGVYKSMDGGASWTSVNDGINTGEDGYIIIAAIAISPNYATDHTIFAGAENYYNMSVGGFYKSTDGGTSWTAANSNLTETSIAISPNYASDHTIFAGTNAGAYKSTDGGASRSEINQGIADTDIQTIAASPDYDFDHTIFAGTNTGIYMSTDGSASWTTIGSGIIPDQCGDVNVGSIAVSPSYTSDQTAFAGTDTGLYKSTDAGANWTASDSGINPDSYGYFYVVSIAVSPAYASDQTIFAGTFSGIFKSIDGGANWTAVNSGITPDQDGDFNISSLAISPSYALDHTVFVGLYNGIYKSADGGANWQLISPIGDVQSFAVSPNYAIDHTVFIGTSYGVLKTADGGKSWMDVNNNITPGPDGRLDITALAISTNYAVDKTIFAGEINQSDKFNGVFIGGVFKSTDGGASWVPVNYGIANTYIQALTVPSDYALNRTVFAGTWYGGVWNYTFNIDLSLNYRQVGSRVILTAKPSGNPITGRIRFYELIGNSRTLKGKRFVDSSGVATLSFKSKTGLHTIISEHKVSKGESEDSNPVTYTIGRVTLIAPHNKEKIAINTPTLSWSSYDGATGYHVQVATTSGFGKLKLLLDQDASDTYIMTPALRQGKTYYWRVRACLSTGSSKYSDIRHFIYKAN